MSGVHVSLSTTPTELQYTMEDANLVSRDLATISSPSINVSPHNLPRHLTFWKKDWRRQAAAHRLSTKVTQSHSQRVDALMLDLGHKAAGSRPAMMFLCFTGHMSHIDQNTSLCFEKNNTERFTEYPLTLDRPSTGKWRSAGKWEKHQNLPSVGVHIDGYWTDWLESFRVLGLHFNSWLLGTWLAVALDVKLHQSTVIDCHVANSAQLQYMEGMRKRG